MITAGGEAVIDRLQANRMTMHATVDARIHFRGPVLSRVVSHDVISVEDAEAPYSGGRKRHANYRSSRRLKSRRINVNPRRLRGTRRHAHYPARPRISGSRRKPSAHRRSCFFQSNHPRAAPATHSNRTANPQSRRCGNRWRSSFIERGRFCKSKRRSMSSAV